MHTIKTLKKALNFKLWYREKENIKEKDTFDIIGLRLSNEQRQKLKELGYNTYDIGSDSFDEPDYVSNRIIINHIGTLITTRDLHLNNYDYVDLDKAINGCEEKYIELDSILDTGKEL